MTLNEFLEKHMNDYIIIDYGNQEVKGFEKSLIGEYNDLYEITYIDNECDYCDYKVTVI